MNIEQQNVLCHRLKEQRLLNGWTLEQLAEKVGVSHVAISRWENNIRTPNMYNIIALAKAFGVSSDYLLGLED